MTADPPTRNGGEIWISYVTWICWIALTLLGDCWIGLDYDCFLHFLFWYQFVVVDYYA